MLSFSRQKGSQSLGEAKGQGKGMKNMDEESSVQAAVRSQRTRNVQPFGMFLNAAVL